MDLRGSRESVTDDVYKAFAALSSKIDKLELRVNALECVVRNVIRELDKVKGKLDL